MAENLLTTRQIDSAKLAPDENERILRDGNGLELRITRSGAYWQMRYQYQERRRVFGWTPDERERIGEGRKGEHLLSTVRRWRAWCRFQLAQGIDPADARIAIAESDQWQRQSDAFARKQAEAEAARLADRLTVSSLFIRWQQTELVKRKDGGAEQFRAFSKDVFPLIGSMPLEDVRRSHVMQVLDAIVARGVNRLANRTLSDLRQMFGFALVRDLMTVDPTARIKKTDAGGRDNERDRALAAEEITLLASRVPVDGQAQVAGVARLELPTQAAIWLMLATMTRVGALTQMRWQDLDLAKRTWVIPDSHAKNGKGYLIHLSSFAMNQLERLRQPREFARIGLVRELDPVWVFPATRKEGPLCQATLQKQIADRQRDKPLSNRTQLHDSLELPGGRWTAHDLRRTGATLMGDLGLRSDVIDKCLGHIEENKVKRIYLRSELLEERQEAFERLGQRLEVLTQQSV